MSDKFENEHAETLYSDEFGGDEECSEGQSWYGLYRDYLTILHESETGFVTSEVFVTLKQVDEKWEHIQKTCDAISWSEAYEQFDEFIDETTEHVCILGHCYDPSRVLKKADPITYRTAFLDWADSEGIDTDYLTGVDREGN